MKKDIKEEFLKAKDEIDKISVNSEVIEHLNQLINEKLDDINEINYTDNKEEEIKQIYNVLRYSSNYVTLNHLISGELIKINESVNILYELVNQIEKNLTNE